MIGVNFGLNFHFFFEKSGNSGTPVRCERAPRPRAVCDDDGAAAARRGNHREFFSPRLIPGNSNIQFGNMSSNTANARGRQGQSNAANSSASWSDERRSGELLDAYIGAPMRLSQDSTIHPGWNPRIDCLSKLEWGQLIIIERETARFLNQNPTYVVTWSFSALSCCLLCLHLQFNLLIFQELAGNKAISALVVKQRIDALCKAAVGQLPSDQRSVHAKAQFISNAEVFICIMVLRFMQW